MSRERGDRDAAGAAAELGPDRVFAAFALETGIPPFLLREDRALRVEEVIAAPARRVVGQPEAVRRVAGLLCVVKAGLAPAGKPLATFLFVGPTGIGKTELARTLATFLFGEDERVATRILTHIGLPARAPPRGRPWRPAQAPLALDPPAAAD